MRIIVMYLRVVCFFARSLSWFFRRVTDLTVADTDIPKPPALFSSSSLLVRVFEREGAVCSAQFFGKERCVQKIFST